MLRFGNTPSRDNISSSNPKTLTQSQRDLLDKLIERFGKDSWDVPYRELIKVIRELTRCNNCPKWIIRNPTIRNPRKVARYDITRLLKLPIAEKRHYKKSGKFKKKQVRTRVQVDPIIEALKKVKS